MRRQRLMWQLYPSYFLMTFLSLAAIGWLAAGLLKQFYLDETAADLEARTRLIENQLASGQGTPPGGAGVSQVRELSRLAGVRITIVDETGRVLDDSHEDPGRMDNHADRPEIRQALLAQQGAAQRHSYTQGENMLYLARAFAPQGQPLRIVRTAVPVTSLGSALGTVYRKLAWAALVIILAVAVLSWQVARRITRSLAVVKAGALRLAQGDLGQPLPVPASEEIGGVVEALNRMASQLDERLATILRQRHELEAVLGSMRESVLAIDPDERLITVNTSAAALFRIDPQQVKMRCLQEVIRNPNLQRFATLTLASSEPTEQELIFYDGDERTMHANGTRLKDDQGRAIGALIVLNDITPLRRLENIRRDFVANVSHEVKTPVTLIQGFVETLLDGGLADPEESQRFLKIILEQARRLNTVLDDLLSLSRIEHAERGRITLEKTPLVSVFQRAEEIGLLAARAKHMRLVVDCPQGLVAMLNPTLIEQAVINLVDNAVKYGNPETTIRLEGEQGPDGIYIRVCDEGPGIASEHLPRLFERFYRVDKARSRTAGGTGLGLAIVKHIIQLHGGRVSVDSTPGRGSCFTLQLPL